MSYIYIYVFYTYIYVFYTYIYTYMFRLHMCGGVWGKTHMYIQKDIYVFARHRHIWNSTDIDIYVYAETYTLAPIFIGKVVFICLVGSVNSVLKFPGQPGETRFQPGGDEISSGVPMTFNTKLTEPKGK